MEKIDAPKPETFNPAGKRILVLPDEISGKSKGGIMLPETAKERPQVGTVIRIGKEVTEYKEKDRVLYGKNAGIRIDFLIGENKDKEPEYKEFYLMQESELFGTL